MNFMPLTRKGGCKVTNFLRDTDILLEQNTNKLIFINQKPIASNYSLSLEQLPFRGTKVNNHKKYNKKRKYYELFLRKASILMIPLSVQMPRSKVHTKLTNTSLISYMEYSS